MAQVDDSMDATISWKVFPLKINRKGNIVERQFLVFICKATSVIVLELWEEGSRLFVVSKESFRCWYC